MSENQIPSSKTKEKSSIVIDNRSSSVSNVMAAIQRGVAGQLMLISASRAWGTKSELALYPTISTIFIAHGWSVRCQEKVAGKRGKGGPRKIDFFASARSAGAGEGYIAVEVKLVASRTKARTLDVSGDIEKLKVVSATRDCASFLLIAGRGDDLETTTLLLNSTSKLALTNKSLCETAVTKLGRVSWGSVIVPLLPPLIR
jgi:hypothetical protein